MTTITRWMTGAWLLRALLAALLMLSSEALLWAAPDSRPGFEWALLLAAYLALASLLLDLAARWRLRDLFGLMALAGVYGLLNAALLNPQTAFADFPRTLFTRAMGGHTLMGLLALAWWLRLTDARASGGAASRVLIGVIACLIGVIGGYWGHYSPPVFVSGGETTLLTIGIAYGALAAIAVGVMLLARRGGAAAFDADSLRLRRGGWALVVIALVPIGAAQVASGRSDGVALTTVALFAAFCAGVVWFQKRARGASLLDGRSLAIDPRRLVIPLVGGAIGVVIGYALPRLIGATDMLALIAALLTAYGLVWLPLVAFVLGAREFSRQSRAMRL